MKIIHKLKRAFAKELEDDELQGRSVNLLLTSKRGHYFSLPAHPSQHITNFNGWFNMIELGNSYTLYKSIDNIYLTDDEGRILRPDSVINKFTSFERDYHDSQEAYTLTKNGLIAEFSSEHAYINIDLDFRQSFDYDDKGRTYIIYREKILDYEQYDKHRAASEAMSKHEKNNQVIIVEYSKYKDNGLKDLDKRYYLVIYGIDDAYEIVDRWERRDYCYDASRNSRSEFYVYKAFRILCKKGMKLFFAFAESKEHAIGKLVDVIFNVPMIKNVQENYIEKLEHKSSISELSDDARGMGYVNCLNSLDGLSVHFQLNHKKLFGIWAGLPWFFQFWARDELLCIRSLILESKFDIAKEILFRHLNEINSDGRLTNIFPASGLGSADAIGWLFKRIEDYIKYLNDNKILGDYLSLYDLKYIRERLRFSIKQLQANYIKEGLMHNFALETWMDTSYKDAGYETDTREGSRIEIQALYLNMLKLMNRLDALLANKFVKKGDKLVSIASFGEDYIKMERDARDLIREHFLVKNNDTDRLILNDGYNCSYHNITRPNIFLAYYIYPELLSDGEWMSSFDDALAKLWCEWQIDEIIGGGISTIDKNHVLYQPFYSGENNKSYHRGDSWFYINNIVAICLSRLNKEKYLHYIEKIMNASTEDMLFSGFIGYCSELSSSSSYKPGGCLCQAWSIATYIEIIHELYM